MRVAVVVDSLGPGGAERVATWLASKLADRGDSVALVTVHGPDLDFHPVAPTVERHWIGLVGASGNQFVGALKNVRRVRALRRCLRSLEPDVVVSFMDRSNVMTIMAMAATGVPVVVSQRVDPRHHALDRATRALRRLLYPRAAAVVVQTEAVAAWFAEFVPRDRLRVVPNAARAPQAGVSGPRKREPLMVAMGRLVPQKGFDLAIRAMRDVADRCPGWMFVILGEGPERARLEALVQELGLEGTVELPGLHRSPLDLLGRASIFVLSSRYEGFPNALLEAMAAGAAPVSFDCESGPSDVIRDGVDGVLVPPEDVEALTDAVIELATDAKQRARLAEEAMRVTERFSEGAVCQAWEDVLNHITAPSTGRP